MDEKDKEKDTPSEPSTDETSPENVTKDDKMTGDKEPMIPKSRFDEINAKKKEAEAELEKLKKTQASKQEPARKEEDSSRLDAVEFMVKHREFDSSDYEAAQALARGRGVSLDEAIKDELFLAYQEKKRSKEDSEEATPQAGRSPKVKPAKPLSEMTRDEHMTHFRKVTESLG